MGKTEGGFLTPKAIANRIKAKGLQKTRWYCQMCQKQCRDANGFKCHLESESHQRQMEIYKGSQGKFIDTFSNDFEAGMLDIIKRLYKTKKVHANVVYNEYIKDRHHIHMNATKWVTLTGFVMHLGKTGQCKVEETPKGWYITYIEKDPALLARQVGILKITKTFSNKILYQAKQEATEKAERDEEERFQKELEQKIASSKKAVSSQRSEPTELIRDGNVKIGFSFKKPDFKIKTQEEEEKKKQKEEEEIEVVDYNEEDYPNQLEYEQGLMPERGEEQTSSQTSSQKEEEEEIEVIDATEPTGNEQNNPTESTTQTKSTPSVPIIPTATETSTNRKRKFSNLDDIIQIEEQKKEKMSRKDYWITEGIIVKVMNQELGDGKYYKKKGEIKKVIDKYIAIVKMLDSGDVLKIDQNQLETVIPQIEKKVKVVNGAYRGEEAILLEIDLNKFAAKVKIASGIRMGFVTWKDYEDICKIPDQE